MTVTPKSPRSLTDGPPPWSAPPTPGRLSLGQKVAAVAEMLGIPLMPWQQLVADVGLELLPGTLIPAYREVIVTVPRQSGKTSLVLAIEVQRALGWPELQPIVYLGQDGSEARRKLPDDQEPQLSASPLGAAVQNVYRAAGHVSII